MECVTYDFTRSSGHSTPFLLASAEGWGALRAPCYGAYGAIAGDVPWAPYETLLRIRNKKV